MSIVELAKFEVFNRYNGQYDVDAIEAYDE